MKLTRFPLGLLFLMSFLSSFFVTNHASAQCIQADVSVQYNISGSQEPTERSNDVDFQSHGNCQGNVSITTGVQGNEGGTSRVRQRRVVRHRFTGNGNNEPGFSGSTIQIKSNPAIDVYNAADRLNY